MPKIWPVTALGFPGLFTDLGIQAVPAGPQFWLGDTILPVSLVNSQITLAAEAVPVLYNRAEIFDGQATAPAVGTVIADTGALTAGDYDVLLWITQAITAAQNQMNFEHRDAANAANIWLHLPIIGDGTTSQLLNAAFSVTLLADERLRVVAGNTMAAGEKASATIFAKRRA